MPTSSSFSSTSQNVGAISNTGVELDVTVSIFRDRDLTWDVNFNAAHNKGKLAQLNEMRATYTDPVVPAITGVSTFPQLMDEIFKEYVVTLIMENESPWFASVRIEHGGRPWIYTLKPDVNFSTNQYCWPIPDEEIKAHSNKIDQNPGLE